ncbi:PadR family transcriptional regulator [uncultured Devosia sp.]|uniref:PadR family transcriptional regulator n=1 Tax=uncultured Devosia sp. TaxID=211434 RepID=UPI0035C9D461
MRQYWREGEPNWRRLEAMARRGWGRFAQGGEGEGFGNMGGNFRIGRMLASGDLRLVALYLIEQQPRHGYDLIKAVEDQSHGFYSPSPGIVYPALTFLEEAGYVTSEVDGNKKLYTITEEGRGHLADNREAIQSTLNVLAKAGEQMQRFREFAKSDWPFNREGGEHPHRHGPGFAGGPDRDMAEVLPEVNDARRDLKAAIRTASAKSEDVQRRLAEVLRRAAADINGLNDAQHDEDVDI